MKKLEHILKNVPIKTLVGNLECLVYDISQKSFQVNKNFLFAALQGTKSDGHIFIEEAIKKGAKAILCERLPKILEKDVAFIVVEDSAHCLGLIANNFYDNPSSKLSLVGITGTNGKTTTSNFLYDLFTGLGEKSGLISTIEIKYPGKSIEAASTTPSGIEINQYLKKMLDEGCKYVFMEVSSHGIDQKRISGLNFEGGIFTNISHDHLDYHKNFKNYLYTKKKFFDTLTKYSFALVNKEDKNAGVILQNTKAKKYFYSIDNLAEFKAKILEADIFGTKVEIEKQEIWTPVIGKFNIYNLLAAYASCRLIKKEFSREKILIELSKLRLPKGRLESFISTNNVFVFVDYAHTPDALEKVLKDLKKLKPPSSSLISVIGCGGDRDKQKRPIMGKIAAKYSTKSIFTSDNPRGEDPKLILEEMITEMSSVEKGKIISVPDRKQAIEMASQLAKSKDIVWIGGKGHETYQEINKTKHLFDDLAIAMGFFKT